MEKLGARFAGFFRTKEISCGSQEMMQDLEGLEFW